MRPLGDAFMETFDIYVSTPSEIVGAGHDGAAVPSQSAPARRARHGSQKISGARPAEEVGLAASKSYALRRADVQHQFAALGADVVVVVADGSILLESRPAVAAAGPSQSSWLSASALAWRRSRGARHHGGRQRKTGATATKMDEGLDTVTLALADRLSIGLDRGAGEIDHHLVLMGASSLKLRALILLEQGEAHLHAAARRRRNLCGEDLEGGSSDRLGASSSPMFTT